MTKAEAALIYASWGWRVLPVVPNGKIPATRHGVNDATTDKQQITKWWTENPDYNIGIAAGSKSGIIVFDVDPRNGGEDSWDEWTKANGNPQDGAMQLTAGGGYHYIAYYDESIRSCKLAAGIDLLSDGRYFVAYPSTVEGRSYVWEGSSDPFEGAAPFRIPQKWLEGYAAIKQNSAKGIPDGEIIRGNRNDALTSFAGAMRHIGATFEEILAALRKANEGRCVIPLPDSEVVQIARSISRYDADKDVAAAMGIGSQAADDILEELRAKNQEFFFTRATSFLSQPSPPAWVIKGWVPDYGVTMLYGESGGGKTFLALDIACHIASGIDWNGKRTKKGLAIYMAGEGHFGLRQRIASWCKKHEINSLDNLLISNKAIGMDAPNSAKLVINTVREMTEDNAVIIVIDTLNNHMGGDENKAVDVNALLKQAHAVREKLNASVMIVHHTGNAADAQHRARGSSAWKGNMDAQIRVGKKDGAIEVSCQKMKDAKEPDNLYGELEPVNLGWVDEDGEPIIGAVFRLTDAPDEVQKKNNSKLADATKRFSEAWMRAGAEEVDGLPYLTRSGLMDYLVNNEGLSEATARTYCNPSKEGRLIYTLVTATIVRAHKHGWVVSDEHTASQFIILKNSR